MSANPNSAHRRSVPVTSQEQSEVIAHRERLQEGDGSLNKELHISTVGSFDHESNRKYLLPIVVPHHSNEDIGHSEAQIAPEQDEASPCLPDDITRKKFEAMEIHSYQGKLPKLKPGNKPTDYSMSYQAGKKEVARTPRKRGRSYSCSELESKNINETKQSLKLPSIFDTQMPSARHCVSASYGDIKHVEYTSEGMNRSTLKKRRNRYYIGIQDTLLSDKDLRLKVKEFLQKPQPKACTPTLRVKKIPDIHLEGKEKRINYDRSLREQFTGVPINTSSCPLMSHFKDRKWYYQDKSGKCRYLRVPESPVPHISFVFTKD